MRDIARLLSLYFGNDIGFLLITFPFNQGGENKVVRSNYISNGRRDDMLHFLKETYYRLSAGQDFPTPEDN